MLLRAPTTPFATGLSGPARVPLLRRLTLVVLVATAATQAGCVSYWRGKEIDADIVALQGQIESMREDQRKDKTATQKQVQDLVARITALETSINASLDRLRTTIADGGLAQEELKTQIAKLTGELEEAKKALEGRGDAGLPAIDAAPGAPALPDNPADLYRYGYERKQANDCREAIRAFSEFARLNGENDRADNALYLLAECQFVQAEYTGSIRTLHLISQKYKTGDKVDDALMLMHDNFVALGQCKDAMPFLESLLADYPRSNRAKAARKKLAATRKSCK